MRKSAFQPFTSTGVFALFLVAAASCAALPQQTFVSASGADFNPCSQAQPCATFGGAIGKTANGGEVDALTPGNFAGDGITISGSITLDGKGMASLSSNGGQIVNINSTPTDTIILRGLSINGGTVPGTPGALEGIFLQGGGTVVLENCALSGFVSDAIFNAAPENSTLILRSTTIVNSPTGIYLNQNGGSLILEHVTITGTGNYAISEQNGPSTITISDSTINGCQYGVFIANTSIHGTATAQTMIARSTISGTTLGGVYAGIGSMSIDSSTFFNNSKALEVNAHGIVRLSNNNFYNNKLAFDCFTSTAIVDSANNNRLDVIPASSQTGCSAFGPVGMQ